MPGRAPTVTAPGVRYEPALLEAVVDLLLRGRPSTEPTYEHFRREADRLYALYPSPQERRAAFDALYSRFFAELGCGGVVNGALAAFAGRIDEVMVARAWAPAEEGAEISADGRMLGLRIRPARFAATADLERFLRHELEHVADMLDPNFAYGDGAAGSRERLPRAVGARFGCLWDCAIDGRIERSGGIPAQPRGEREVECARLFPALPEEAISAVVHRLWEGERPTYPTLAEWARHPEALAAWAGYALPRSGGNAGARPGAACPLCGFPTYDWAAAVDTATAALIQGDVPGWRQDDGACARCVESYQFGTGGAR